MPLLELSFESGEDSLSVRTFSVREAVSGLFSVSLMARSPNADLDLESIVGKPASFRLENGYKFARMGARTWSGVCSYIEQVGVEPTGLSTYQLRIAPALWLLGHRQNHRIFQHRSIPDITDDLLGEWGLSRAWKIDRGQYPKLEYRVQYGESDLAFLVRLWEEAGIAFTFADAEGAGALLTLSDELHGGAPRPGAPLPYVDSPKQASELEFVTAVRLSHEVRPGAYTVRDYDFRNPSFPLFGKATSAPAPEDRYEQFHYRPGGFLVETGAPDNTPTADDKGFARYDQRFGAARAERALLGERAGRRAIAFTTNAMDLGPGSIFSISGHPHSEIPAGAKLLVTELSLDGSVGGEWRTSGRAVFADVPYRPPLSAPKPEVTGVQSATVVGPKGQEIHTDEFGRVRVQFPWDREGKLDDDSSCWIRVSQGWAGTGYGMIMLPRVGQEVLVGFLEGDPDQPIIVGRAYNATQRVPYKLPEHKTRSTWKSDSTPGSGGFNEIMFEDLAGSELVFLQAQKNLRKLVKNNESITVGRDRQKLVKGSELEVTGVDRVEVTGEDRTEITGGHRTSVTRGNASELVHGDRIERTEGERLSYVGQDYHLVVKEKRRELVEMDRHLRVKGHRNEQIDGTLSVSSGSKQEKVGGDYALEAGKEVHLKANTALVIEAVDDLTIKGPGGFIRIDASGVTIKGTLVRINSGGSAGSGAASSPSSPELPKEATVAEPQKPTPDDVSKTGIGQ